jgi:hypothetical protein
MRSVHDPAVSFRDMRTRAWLRKGPDAATRSILTDFPPR